MLSITDQILIVFCFIDDYFQAHPEIAAWRTSAHARPAFTDAEVLTIGVMQGCFGCATLKRTFLLVQNNWRYLFPRLPSYAQWLARLHKIAVLVGHLVQQALPPLLPSQASEDQVYLIDSKPIPVCKPIRHGRVRLLRDEGAYFGKNKAGWYFGFKLHLLCHHQGAILGGFLTAGNVDDREVAAALAEGVDGGLLLADYGYKDEKELEPLLFEEFGVSLLTPFQAGKISRDAKCLVSSVRERIETCFSGLWSRFVDRVYSRSFHGLWKMRSICPGNTVKIKMLHYNLCKAGVLP
jgi:hypothetical protein